MSAASSSITSTSYQSVTHKKNLGTIILNDASFTFYPAGAASSDPTNPKTNVVAIWVSISKHQVSPITHARFLLKVVLQPSSSATAEAIAIASATAPASAPVSISKSTKPTSLTFELKSRDELERIRQDVSTRLTGARRIQAQNALQVQSINNQNQNQNRKRGFEEITSSEPSASAGEPTKKQATSNESSFTALTDTSLAVTCSSLLSTDSTLRMHYSLLVLGQPPPSNTAFTAIIDLSKIKLTPILSENDFWFTHKTILANHSAKIHGTALTGISSAMKSSLDLLDIGTRNPIHIGVEEMRQIFILYPAVHKAYEAMVPLELSEEQFWRKYLESEYFHRDRGRLGTHFQKITRGASAMDKKDEDGELQVPNSHSKDDTGDGSNALTSTNATATAAAGGGSGNSANGGAAANTTANKKEEAKEQKENARVAAASSSDIFSRAELELTKHPHAPTMNQNSRSDAKGGRNEKKFNTALAIGQFDLAATANTERGSKLLLYSNDSNRPSNEDTKGSKVIEKYNRHWAIVMNPAIATAGSNLMDLARESVGYVLDGDDDAKVAGGVGKEMERLVGFAGAREGRVDHVKGLGDPVSDEKNCYGEEGDGSSLFQELTLQTIRGNSGKSPNDTGKNERLDNLATLSVLNSVMRYDTASATKEGNCFPEPSFGCDLLKMLTKKMKDDSLTESDTIKMTNQLDENFRNKLTLYFRRATELLRHFFALRQVMETEKRFGKSTENVGKKTSEKITKVVECMKQVYHEMDIMRDNLPSETKRGMCFPIMSQLDSACMVFDSGGGGGGGFVTVQD